LIGWVSLAVTDLTDSVLWQTQIRPLLPATGDPDRRGGRRSERL